VVVCFQRRSHPSLTPENVFLLNICYLDARTDHSCPCTPFTENSRSVNSYFLSPSSGRGVGLGHGFSIAAVSFSLVWFRSFGSVDLRRCHRQMPFIVISRLGILIFFSMSKRCVFGCVECMICRLLLPMSAVSVCQSISVMQLTRRRHMQCVWGHLVQPLHAPVLIRDLHTAMQGLQTDRFLCPWRL